MHSRLTFSLTSPARRSIDSTHHKSASPYTPNWAVSGCELAIRGAGKVLDLPSRQEVLETFSSVGAALSTSDWPQLRTLISDASVRQRVVDEFAELLPRPESRYGLEIRKKNEPYARFTQRQILVVHEYRRRVREPEETTGAVATVAGVLVKIDFGGRKITIRHHPTSRMLDCEYNPDIEEMLLENRRGLVQVTGVLELDKHDRPVRVTDVFDIRDLDLSPITIDQIDGMYRKLRFVSGSRDFAPQLDEEGQLLIVEDPELDLHAYAATRADLLSEIREHLEFLWLEYVESEEAMTDGAAALASRLKAVLEVVDA